ncbi:MAG: polyphosphate polymerase domain-containing protein [Methanomicrobiales archaeon]|jgi:hypothetical protein|nr:polyphosphate polymerase domain-containing protein [Methanomicrobiales archaeon]
MSKRGYNMTPYDAIRDGMKIPFKEEILSKEEYLPYTHHTTTIEEISKILHTMQPISLEGMTEAALMSRKELKYLLYEERAKELIIHLSEWAYVLEIEGTRIGSYESVYFDTDGFTTYLHHHNGRRKRHKLRARRYVVSDLSFLEIKEKVKKNNSKKVRIQTDHLLTKLGSGVKEFISSNSPYDPDLFEAKLFNTYKRVTLVTPDFSQRITLDFDLAYERDGVCIQFPNVVIVEVKTDEQSYLACKKFMRQLHLHSTTFSKYCIGISLMYPAVKKNQFKQKLRRLMDMTQRRILVC